MHMYIYVYLYVLHPLITNTLPVPLISSGPSGSLPSVAAFASAIKIWSFKMRTNWPWCHDYTNVDMHACIIYIYIYTYTYVYIQIYYTCTGVHIHYTCINCSMHMGTRQMNSFCGIVRIPNVILWKFG